MPCWQQGVQEVNQQLLPRFFAEELLKPKIGKGADIPRFRDFHGGFQFKRDSKMN
jgi:hypothetical protein